MNRVLAALWLLFLSCGASRPPVPAAGKADSLAKCLTRKEARLYGASWCLACKKQLELFGKGAAHLSYVDCVSKESFGFIDECGARGLHTGSTLPQWVFADGSRLVGARDPKLIAEVAGCPYDP